MSAILMDLPGEAALKGQAYSFSQTLDPAKDTISSRCRPVDIACASPEIRGQVPALAVLCCFLSFALFPPSEH